MPKQPAVTQIEFPTFSTVAGKETEHYYRDTFAFDTCQSSDLNATKVYHAIFGYLPKTVVYAMKVRNSIVKWLGFSTAGTEIALPIEEIKQGNKAGFLTIETVTPNEVVTFASEKNMDIWLSVLEVTPGQYAISSLVNLKTRMGRAYMVIIKPFHKIIARYCIVQALKTQRIPN